MTLIPRTRQRPRAQELDLAGSIAVPPGWREADRRALRALAAARALEPLRRWLVEALRAELPGEDRFAPVRDELAAAGLDDVAVAELLVPIADDLAPAGHTGAAGRFLLGLADETLRAVIASGRDLGGGLRPLLAFLFAAAPERVPALVPAILERSSGFALPPVCACLLERAGERYEPQVVAIFRAQPSPLVRFQIGVALDRLSPARHGEAALAAARTALARAPDEGDHPLVIEWMLQQFPSDTLAEIAAYVATGEARDAQRRVLELAARLLGTRAAPILHAALARGADDLRLDALAHLLALGVDRDEVRAGIERGMQSSDPARVLRFLALAIRVGLAEVPAARRLLTHGARPVRDAAARAFHELETPPARTGRYAARRSSVTGKFRRPRRTQH